LHLNSTSRKDVTVSYRLRDLDTNADNAAQQVALQFRPMDSGNWIDVPAAYVADATAGPNVAGPDILRSVTLPADANDRSQLQVRIITSDAAGSDEWVGIDDILVTSTPCSGPCPVPPPPVLTQIWEIQGTGRISPKLNEVVSTQGIVTARARNGFYLQAAVSDGNPLTSDGIFVFTSGAPDAIAQVGHLIQVSGRVSEFSDLGESAPTLTELISPFAFQTIATGNVANLPPVTPLTATDLSPANSFDGLERYEGMLVSVLRLSWSRPPAKEVPIRTASSS
jgi:predicted extracellular nuclease